VAAMADADVVIEGVKEKGKILSLTTGEALELGLIDKQVINMEELIGEVIATEKTDNIQVIEQKMSFSEKIAHIATNPYIAPILLTVGIVGTITEILTPGFGIPGLLGLIAFGLFFGGNFLAGAAQFWVLSLFVLGILLLIMEMFVPGFGIFGVAGILSIIASVIMAFPNPEQAMVSILIALIASGVIIYFLVKYLIKTPIFDRIILGTKQEKSDGYIVSSKEVVIRVGEKGKAITPLRPAGVAIIGNNQVDVLSEGQFLPSGSDIVVIKVEGNKILVKKEKKENV
ncbi:MAG: NfeD family protein, partial [Tepidanaerobacteraceae bacterium]|nr:NfeD family protein [Tepidanaerobacteraceae bacterium]